MNVSKLTIGKEVAKHGERRLDILKFLQEEQDKNPRFLKNTSLKHLAKCYSMRTGTNASTAQTIMSKMVKNNMIIIHRLKVGRDARANYRINYLYPGLPQEFIDKATEEDKDFIKDIYARLDDKKAKGENCVLDGKQEVIITKPEPVNDTTLVPKVEESKVIPVSTPVEVSRNGSNISITINLNIGGLN